MNDIILHPVAYVRNPRHNLEDDNWAGVISEIMLDESLPDEGFDEIETFSHAEIIFYFDRVDTEEGIPMSRHPRGNRNWPKVGVFAQRNKDRPNHIGLTIVRIIRCERRSLFVEGLDAADGTPVLDIKPVMREYLPRGLMRQPEWSHELMKNYWDQDS